MADRYWVGGAGTWDATTTTNWSATSGGAGGASAPTSADNVIFNTSSNATAYAVTVGTDANALDITINGPAAGSVTITSGATAVINCYGSWTSAATGVVFTTTTGAKLNFLATTTGKTITTNNVTLGAVLVTLDGVGGAWSLGSAFTCTNNITVTNGTFTTTASNYALNLARFNSDNSNVRSISLNASIVTVTGPTGIDFTTGTNLTFNAGTSTITASGNSPTFNGGGQTYYIVNFTSVSSATTTINGANTFTNLSFTSRTTDGVRAIVVSANQTISGTLTLGAANTAVRRVAVRSDTIGTQRTLTVATIATLADVDFQDIVAAGASGTWSGTRLGNCTNNSNITFAAGANKYWNLAGAQNWSAVAWATSSGGAPAVNNFPLAQDTAIFDNTGSITGTITIQVGWNLPAISITKTGAMTLANGTQTPLLFGGLTLQAATVTTGTGIWSYAAYGVASTFTSNTATFTPPLTIQAPTGTVTLADGFTQPSTVTTTLTAGTLDLVSYTLTTGLFSSTNSNTRTLAFGTGNITLTGVNTTIFNTTTVTGMAITGTPVVNCTATTGTSVQTRTFIAGAHGESQSISVNINPGTSAVDIFRLATNSGAFKDVTFSSTFTGTVQISNTIFIYGNYNFGGATAYSGTSTVTFAATSGTKTITSNVFGFPGSVTFNGAGGAWALQGNLTINSTATTTLTAGTLDLNNFTLTTGTMAGSGSGVRRLTTNSVPIIVTGNSATVVSFGTTTNMTADVAPTFNLTSNPVASTGSRTLSWGTPSNTNVLPIINVTNGSDTFTTSGTSTIRNLTFTGGFTGTLGNFGRSIYGNLTLVSGMTVSSGALTNTFTGVGSHTITSAGQTLDFPITFDGVGGTWTLQDALTSGSSRTLTLTNGTLNLNNFTLTTGLFSSSNSNTRTLAFGTGKMVLTGNDAAIFLGGTGTGFTYTGTSRIEAIYSGSVGTRFISTATTATSTEATALNFYITAGSDTLDFFTSDRRVNTLDFTGFTGTFTNAALTVHGSYTLAASPMVVGSGTLITTFATTGYQTITTNDQVLDFPVIFDGIGGEWECQDTFNVGPTLTMTNGTLKLKSSAPNSVGAFATSGTNQKFLQSSTPGTQAGLVQFSGTNNVSYLTIEDISASGGAVFQAFTSNFNVNAGNNTGWYFLNSVNFLPFF